MTEPVRKPRKVTKRLSPYRRHQKSPYLYAFKTCTHRNSTFQSLPGWKGKVCASCNIIMQGPKPEVQSWSIRDA